MHSTIRIIILSIACLSPLLTYAKLWQIKEWRIDRLKEHLRAEGWVRQLVGITRPVAVVLALGIALTDVLPNAASADIGLVLLALLSLAHIVLRKQKYPVWTGKAVLISVLSMLFTFATSYWLLVIGHWSLVISLPLLQPVFIVIGWLFLLPIDRLLKQRIMRKAKELLESFTNTTVIGITGSVGKTTTKELIHHVLRKTEVLCTPAYVNSEMGVSQWLLKTLQSRDKEEKLTLIVEMGAYRKGEIRKLCEICKPRMGIITFIGMQHLALFGSQENLANAKGELLECLPENGRAFINADCTPCVRIAKKARCPVTLVGTAGRVDIEAQEIEEQTNGISFRVGDTHMNCPLHGTHNVTNALLMIGVCKAVGVTEKEIAERIRSFVPPSSTFDVRRGKGVTVLDDTHNASPASFRAAIAWAAAHPAQYKTLITPGLIELGTTDTHVHRELGIQASCVFDRVVFTQKNGLDAFEEGYTKQVERYRSAISRVPSESLLVCVGRVHPNQIDRILPQPKP